MRKADVKTKEDLKEYYKKTRKIKIKDIENIDLDEIFKAIIIDKKETTYSRGGHQCKPFKDRSTDDYIKVAKFYHPEATIKEILAPITKYYDTNNNTKYYGFCPNIRKDNFRSIGFGMSGKNFLSYGFKQQGFKNCNVKFEEM